MRFPFRYAVLALLAAGVAGMLLLALPGSLIYFIGADNSSSSSFHDNVDALKAQQINSTTDLLPAMQDLLDFTGPVSLSIRIHDIDQARRDLQRYSKSYSNLNNLIVKLDMNESDMEDFSKNSKRQNDLLQELANASASLHELNSLEIQYRSTDNPGMLRSVQMEGDTLRKKMQDINVQYQSETKKNEVIANRTGLDTTKSAESRKDIQTFVEEETKVTAPATPEVSLPIGTQLTLFLLPDAGTYGDTIEAMGHNFAFLGNHTTDIEEKPVSLFMDGNPVSNTSTDALGSYTIPFAIDHIVAGSHALYSQSGETKSELSTLNVTMVGSVTTLTLGRPDRGGNVTASGTVTANRPVHSAPVQVVWDDTHVVDTMTNSAGNFQQVIQLPVGNHTVRARFTGDGYPISPSVSPPRKVVISGFDFGSAGIVVAVLSILILPAAGFVYFRIIRRRKVFPAELIQTAGDIVFPGPAPEQTGETILSPEDVPWREDLKAADQESLVSRYHRILQDLGLSEASRAAYQRLARRIARDNRIVRHETQTPREMLRHCRAKPYCGVFAAFVPLYERIRYGRLRSVRDQTEFETVMFSAEEQMGGGNH